MTTTLQAAAQAQVPHLRLADGLLSALSTIEVMVLGVAACRAWVTGAHGLASGHGLDDASAGRLVQVGVGRGVLELPCRERELYTCIFFLFFSRYVQENTRKEDE